ncbi:MAG: T9SS type A sorting domain-containing protein [Ignavibacterium sp.]|nr:T9SS type A sorting domain-containing protein [Ignavibacterium sp.]
MLPKRISSDSFNYLHNFISTNNSFAIGNTNGVLRMDSIIASSVEGGRSKVLFEYDDEGNIKNQLFFHNIGNVWFNGYSDFYYYDETGNRVLEIRLEWNINNWDTLSRIDYIYKSEGKLFQYIFQSFSEQGWLNKFRQTFTYDSNGNRVNTLEEVWIENKWQNNFMVEFYFSEVNQQDSLIFQISDNNEWKYFSKTHFYYNLQTNFLEYFLFKLWAGSGWIDYLRRSILNDLNGNQIEHLEEIWEQGNWTNSVKRIFSYNGLNYTESAYCEIWNVNNWIPGNDIIIIENPDGFSIAFITHSMNIYYLVTSINEDISTNPDEFVLSQNYPNPFNSSTQISYQLPMSGMITLKIYNVIGQEVAELVNEVKQAGVHTVQFDGSNLASGVYMYKLSAEGRSGNFVSTKKMMLIK